MEIYFTYLIQSTISIAVLFLAYKLLFAGKGFFEANRMVLFSIIGFGFFGPYLAASYLPGLSANSASFSSEQLSQQLAAISLQEIVVTPLLSLENDFSLIKILGLLYLTVAAVFLLRLLFSAGLLLSLLLKSETMRNGRYTYVLLPQGSASFSFFNLLFLDRALVENARESDQIIQHEKIHFQQLHSIDIILVELLLVFQWFNPFAYFLRKAVIENNEYLTDQKTIDQTANKSDYKLLLLKNTLQQSTYVLTNNFSYSLLKKRIKMMEKEKSKLRLLLSCLAFLLVFTMVSISCSNQSENEKQKDQPTVVVLENGKLVEKPDAEVITPQIDKTREPGEDVFSVVEKVPEYPGGVDGLYRFLADNVKYPEQAKKDSIMGRVFVNFIVEKDGKVSTVKVLRGIGGGCDEEAIRVVSMMPKWIPGTQGGKAVRVSFNLPIKFALE